MFPLDNLLFNVLNELTFLYVGGKLHLALVAPDNSRPIMDNTWFIMDNIGT